MIESTSEDELIGKLRAMLKDLIPSQKPCNEVNVLLTRQEVADYFQVSFQTLHNWKRHKKLIPINVGTRVYYRKSDIDDIANGKGVSHEV